MVHGGARDRQRQFGANHRLTGHGATGDAFRITTAENRVLDQFRIDARALDCGTHCELGERGAGGDVEFALMRLGHRSACGRDNDGFAHGQVPE